MRFCVPLHAFSRLPPAPPLHLLEGSVPFSKVARGSGVTGRVGWADCIGFPEDGCCSLLVELSICRRRYREHPGLRRLVAAAAMEDRHTPRIVDRDSLVSAGFGGVPSPASTQQNRATVLASRPDHILDKHCGQVLLPQVGINCHREHVSGTCGGWCTHLPQVLFHTGKGLKPLRAALSRNGQLLRALHGPP